MLVNNQLYTGTIPSFAAQNISTRNKTSLSTMLNDNKGMLFASQKALANYNVALINFKGGKSLPEITPELIKDLTEDPRTSSSRFNKLTNGVDDDYNWRFVKYPAEFKKFTEQQLERAGSLEELIQFRPDWNGATLRKKYAELHPGRKIELGQPPEELGGKEGFEQIARHLADTLKSQKDKVFSKNYEPEDLRVNGQTLKFKALTNGKTGKVPFIVEMENGKQFVIKIQPNFYHGNFDSFESCDSVALSAMIDFYLTLNHCENSPKIYYYNEDHNASVYEFVPKQSDGGKLNSTLRHYGSLKSYITDFEALGMQFNDTLGSDNMHYNNGRYVVIDNGHCTFNNSAKPAIREYHQDLPNNLWMNCFFG